LLSTVETPRMEEYFEPAKPGRTKRGVGSAAIEQLLCDSLCSLRYDHAGAYDTGGGEAASWRAGRTPRAGERCELPNTGREGNPRLKSPSQPAIRGGGG